MGLKIQLKTKKKKGLNSQGEIVLRSSYTVHLFHHLYNETV